MSVSYKQIGYISHSLKVNRNAYKELKEMFPPQINNGADISLVDLEAKLSRLDPVAVSDVIEDLKEDKILDGFRQLKHLIRQVS